MTFLKSLFARPAIWIITAILLAVIDLQAPSHLAVCAVHALLLPIAWRLLHRRHVSLLTATLMVAVVIPGLVHLMRHSSGPSEETENVKAAEMAVIDPARVWTTLTLAAAGLFHINLQRARRRRVALRRELQQKVRRRTDELRQVNQTLRQEVQRRRTTEHLLDRSETHLQSLIDRMQLQVLRKDRDGTIIYANETFCKQLGRYASDVIGKHDSEFYPPELAESYRADDIRVMETGKPVDHVEEHPAADGGTGYVQVFKAPEYDQQGQCVGIQVIFWDVTEKHRSAIALRDSEARKRALFETAADAVLLTDRDQQIIEANPSAARLFLTPTSQLVGSQLSDIAQPTHSDDVAQVAGWSDLRKATRHEMTLARSDGSRFDSEVSVHAIPMGSSEGMAIIVRDVTVQREAIEALRQAKLAAEATSRTKSEFMAGVSHELRTPLGGITGLTELLMDTPLSPRGRQYVDMIRQSGSQLSDVIEDILDFSAIEAGQVQINPEPIDLHAVVGNAFKSLAARAVGKPLSLALSIDPKTPRRVVADPKRIRQIVMNLGGNAVKFTPDGTVSLRLEPDPDRGQGSLVAINIAVTDTGVGIPADKRQSVFEAFERGEEGTTRRFGGTGLGLSISNELARRLGGYIELQSEVDVGSTFTCRLQLELDPSNERARRSTDPSNERARRSTDPSNEEEEPSEESPLPFEFPFHKYVVRSGCDQTDAGIGETLRAHGITPAQKNEVAALRDPILWVVSVETSQEAELLRLRDDQDVVVWITRLGQSPPEIAHESDSILTQPVLPDELLPAVSRPASDESDFDYDIEPSKQDRAQAENAKLRLLLVDDSPVNRTVIGDQLLTAGFQIDMATGGAEAIEMAGRQSYDCILMDLQMPDVDGIEATRRIHEDCLRHSQASPPIIALTAHVTQEHRQRCLDAGMQGFITKPIDREKLLLEIGQHTKDNSAAIRPSSPLSQDVSMSSDLLAQDSWRQQMKSHSGSRPETLLAICDAFLEEVPSLVDRIRTAVDADDASTLKTASHTLKSCLSYVAVEEDVKKAAAIEAESKNPRSISPQQLDEIDRIAGRWIECVKTLRSETAELVAEGAS